MKEELMETKAQRAEREAAEAAAVMAAAEEAEAAEKGANGGSAGADEAKGAEGGDDSPETVQAPEKAPVELLAVYVHSNLSLGGQLFVVSDDVQRVPDDEVTRSAIVVGHLSLAE